MGFDVPILFLVFNRPDLAGEVVSVLRRLGPKRLFIAADGPRTNLGDSESELCRLTRAVATTIDWEEGEKLISSDTVGCMTGNLLEPRSSERDSSAPGGAAC